MTIEADNTQIHLSDEEMRSVVKQLVYRKMYNRKPAVVEARRKYNQRRQAVVKLALEAWKAAKGGKA